jgi:RES domain-containing protein
MVYTAESQSLAALEILVQTADPNDLVDLDYVAIPVELDERMIDEAAKIPSDWRGYPAPHSTMKIGDQWVRAKSSLALRVPSAIIPAEWNYLLNPAHLDFSKLRIGKPLSFDFDRRLAFKPEKQKRSF